MIGLSPRDIASALGGEVSGRNVLAPGPGHSRHDRSLSIRVDATAPDGFVVHSFAADDPIACKDYVRQRLGLPQFATSRHREVSSAEQRAEWERRREASRHREVEHRALRQRQALTIWSEALAAPGTIAETYLRTRCGDIPDGLFEGDALRFHPECPFRDKRLPAMVALFRDTRTNEPRAIHRTALLPDGSWKDTSNVPPDGKRWLGEAAGCAIKLTPDEDVTLGLSICEGIETGVSVMLPPVWARPMWIVGSTANLQNFPILSGIEGLGIFADHDANGAGERAAIACALRYDAAGIEAEVVKPRRRGDWNDVLGPERPA
jgi:hypothetical protein